MSRLWDRVRGWFDANATHLTVAFVEEPEGQPLYAYQGYVRVWLSEGFLANARTWGNDHFPALHGGVSLQFLGEQPTVLTSFARPPGSWTSPGARFDYPVTSLVPFGGGTVEIEAALYQVSLAGPLATAVQVIGSLASLMGPPLSAAAAIADKVSSGLDAVLAASGDQPVLGFHSTLVSPGGGGQVLRPGHIVVINAPAGRLIGSLSMVDGRLTINSGEGPRQLTGVDYLVIRIECRAERDDWRFPELDRLILAAGEAGIEGHEDTFQDRRTDAIARAWNSRDLTPVDRKRVAKLVADEIDASKRLGIVPGEHGTFHDRASQRLLPADAPELSSLRLKDLLY